MVNLDTPKKVGLFTLVLVGVGFAFGWSVTPTKTVTKTEVKTEVVEKEKIVYKEKENSKTDNKKDKIIIKVETILPDGTRRIETKIIDKGSITIDMSKESNQETEKQTETKTETKTETVVERTKDQNRLSLLVSPSFPSENILLYPVSFGVSYERRFIGPFHLGAFGLTNKVFGVSAGVSF